MKEKLLPIGSVVMLEGGTKPLMITGYKMKDKEESEKIYDYVGCIFPEGLMEELYGLFDNDQIKDVLFVGYGGEEFEKQIQNVYSVSASGEVGTLDNGVPTDFVKSARRTPKPPTKPRSKSEMRSMYGVKKWSNGGIHNDRGGE